MISSLGENLSPEARAKIEFVAYVGVTGVTGVGFDGAETWSLHATISSERRLEYFIVDKGNRG
jgi:hypothetical protein